MKLVSVYRVPEAVDILYSLLAERRPEESISHTKLPSMADHRTFVYSHPYAVWYLIEQGHDYVGTTYLTKHDEIGIFVFKAHQRRGYGRRAVELLRQLHPGKHLWNVNPANLPSIELVEKLGGKIIQHTYIL